MLDIDLTSPGHSRSKQMSPNERPYDFLSVINNTFGRICKGFQITCVTWIDLLMSLKVKDNGAKWNFIYDFLYVNNGN